MGGSAIGGDLARTLVQGRCPVPITVCREYDLPAYAGKNTLVIGSSYSGDTEETLSAFAQAAKRGCKLLAMTTGGADGRRRRAHEAPGADLPLSVAAARRAGLLASCRCWPFSTSSD